MKLLKFTYALALCAIISSCSSDDNNTEDLTGQTGSLDIKFDNAVGDQNFIFNTSYNRANGESFKLETLKYIISNITLKDSNGNTFMYPDAENVFIIDEADGNNASEIYITLDNVNAADYTEITFGIGIDQSRYLLGAEGQGDFLAMAESEGMMWSWATGFRFMRFDGTFSNATLTDEPLNMHMGSVGTSLDNYREVTLTFPNSVRVRQNASPELHIVADIAKVFDGTTSVSFANGYSQVHTSAETTPVIADNFMGVFSVHHVHNN